jgi:hypothetical protein
MTQVHKIHVSTLHSQSKTKPCNEFQGKGKVVPVLLFITEHHAMTEY